MARRKVKKEVDNKKLIIDAFAEMAREKSIDRDLLQGIVEETLKMMVRKKYGEGANFECIVNMDKGDIEIYMMKDVVDEVDLMDPDTQITPEDILEMNGEEMEVGDEYIEEITLENISSRDSDDLASRANLDSNLLRHPGLMVTKVAVRFGQGDRRRHWPEEHHPPALVGTPVLHRQEELVLWRIINP